MAIDAQKLPGRRLRIRIDVYRRTPTRRFDPVKGQAVTLTVEGRAEHRALFRHLVAFIKGASWKNDPLLGGEPIAGEHSGDELP